jgi:hypothetical protein
VGVPRSRGTLRIFAGREVQTSYAKPLEAARGSSRVVGGGSVRCKPRLMSRGHHSSRIRGRCSLIDSPTAPLCRRVECPGDILDENRMSKATRLASKARATRQYMQTLRRLRKLNRAFECEYGHFACAAEPDGACTDELLRVIGKAADDSDLRP